MGAAVVRREDLDVLDVAPAVRPEELDLEVGKLDTSVGVREVVILGPSANVIAISSRPAVAVRPAAVRLLEERLIFAPKVLLEDHALDVRALFDQALRTPQICSIQLRVVNQLTLTGEAVMKRLSWIVVRGSVRFQEFASSVGQRHEVSAGFPIDRSDMANQPFGAKVVEVAVPQVGSPVAAVPEVVDGNHAKCAHGRERAHLGAAQVVLLVADRHGFAVEAARQVEALSKDVARIDGVEVAGIAIQATAAASGRPVSGVVPTGIIEERHESHRGFFWK